MENGWLIVLVMALSLAISFFMSGMEAGVFALSRLRIRQLMRTGRPRAAILYGYLQQPENFLWTILVGNTLANFAAVGLTVMVLFRWFGSSPAVFWPVFAGCCFLFYTLCDLLPKVLFRTFPNRLCLALVGPFRFVHALLSPLVGVLSWFANRLLQRSGGPAFTGRVFGSRDELRQVMQESAQAFTSDERAMINRVLDLQNRTVDQVTTALGRAVTVTTQTPMSEVLRLSREKSFTRMPVWQTDASRPRIVGIVSLKTLLYLAELDPKKTAGDYVKPALFLDETMRLEEALRRMQRSGQRLAIVLGHDTREIGILSLQDVLKIIFGEVSL